MQFLKSNPLRKYNALALIVSIFIVSSNKNVQAQGVYAPLDPWQLHLIDRQEMLQGRFDPNLHLSFKPLLRQHIAMRSFNDSIRYTGRDRFNRQYLMRDNADYLPDTIEILKRQKPVLKYFFGTYQAWYSVREADFTLVLNPISGAEFHSYDYPARLSHTARGAEVRGLIAQKVGFYSMVSENIDYYPDYVRSRITQTGAVPGQGFWKYTQNRQGYDYFLATGYVTFPLLAKYIHVQFGQDKNFIGNGYRSLILSDQSARYLFGKITTKIWKIQYTNLYADLTARIINANQINTRKYMVLHHLSYNISPKLNIGAFEHIIFSRGDSLARGSYEINYLNPIIFYREVESYLGSKDKVTVGTDFKYLPVRNVSIYGQFVLNEFVLRYLRSNTGWWGNKYAYQLGAKYINILGIKNLDVQVEYNRIRPFTLTDKEVITGFTHYQQPLAHPLGANLHESIVNARYQVHKRLFLQTTLLQVKQGLDSAGTNFGGDLLKPYTTRTLEFGNKVGQGIPSETMLLRCMASYMLFHNFFLDIVYQNRRQTIGSQLFATSYYGAGFRWNMYRLPHLW